MGQGFAGLTSNILRTIVLVFLGDSDKDMNISAIIFFGISSLIILISLISTFFLYNNDYFNEVLIKAGVFKGEIKEELLDQEVELKNIDEEDKTEKKEKSQMNFITLIFKIIDINLIMVIVYIGTFGVFPGILIKPTFFSFSMGWKLNIILTLFNIFDTIGRKLVVYLPLTKFVYGTISILRLLSLGTSFYICYADYNKLLNLIIMGILIIVNTAFIGCTGGICTTMGYGLAPNYVDNEWKGKAGSSVSIFLATGIALGSILGIKMDALTNFQK